MLTGVYEVKMQAGVGDEYFEMRWYYRDLFSPNVLNARAVDRLATAFAQNIGTKVEDLMSSECRVYGWHVRPHSHSDIKFGYAAVSSPDAKGTVNKPAGPTDMALCLKRYAAGLPRKIYSRTFIKGIPEDLFAANRINTTGYNAAILALGTASLNNISVGVAPNWTGLFKPVVVYRSSEPGAPIEYSSADVTGASFKSQPARQRRSHAFHTGTWLQPNAGTTAPTVPNEPPADMWIDTMFDVNPWTGQQQ